MAILLNPKCLSMASWTTVRMEVKTKSHMIGSTEYLRSGPDNWQECYGDTIEYLYSDELTAELEALYQANKAQFGIVD